MADIAVNEKIDITRDICPITFVKTKLRLEQMQPGEVLEVTMTAGEPLLNVPRSVKDEGHKILKVERVDENLYHLYIMRGEG